MIRTLKDWGIKDMKKIKFKNINKWYSPVIAIDYKKRELKLANKKVIKF